MLFDPTEHPERQLGSYGKIRKEAQQHHDEQDSSVLPLGHLVR